MLPKVANHLLHHTARAAAVVQNQTGYFSRNVLQLQTSSNPATGLTTLNGASSSSWGNGPGPGGKYQGSSRFYSGYQGAGRAVTQANTSAAQDGDFSQGDDEDLRPPRPVVRGSGKGRGRSQSLSHSGPGRRERGEALGVLRTVQMHVRRKHTFLSSTIHAPESSEPSDQLVVSNTTPSIPTPPRVISRRNSTAAAVSSQHDVSTAPPPPRPASPRSRPPSPRPLSPVPSVSSQSSESVTEKLLQKSESEAIIDSLKSASTSGDYTQAYTIVQAMRAKETGLTIAHFNAALDALFHSRRGGQPLHFLIDTYNDMLNRSITPNFKTYLILLSALTVRDAEVQRTIATLESRAKRRMLSGRSEVATESVDQRRIAALREENNFGSAMSLFEAGCTFKYMAEHFPPWLYRNLMRSAAMHANLDAALMIFNQIEKRQDIKPSPPLYSYLISIFTDLGDLRGAEDVFTEFLKASKAGHIDWSINEEQEQPWFLDTKDRSAGERVIQLNIWNSMIEASFRCEMPEKGIELLAQMMDSKSGENYGPADVPPPASATFTTVISGFIRSGDVDTALAWFDKLLLQDMATRHPLEASSKTCKPDAVAWNIMLETLVEKGRINDLNRLFKHLLEDDNTGVVHVRWNDREMVFEANLRHLESSELDRKQALELMDFVANEVILNTDLSLVARAAAEPLAERFADFVGQYVRYGYIERAVDIVEQWIASREKEMQTTQVSAPTIACLRATAGSSAHRILGVDRPDAAVPSIDLALRIARLCDHVSLLPSAQTAPRYLRAYANAKTASHPLDLTSRDWELLLYAAVQLVRTKQTPVSAPVSLEDLLKDLATHSVDLATMSEHVRRSLVETLYAQPGGVAAARGLLRKSGHHDFVRALGDDALLTPPTSPEMPTVPASPATKRPRVDRACTRYVGEFYPSHPQVTPSVAFARFQESAAQGIFPSVEVMGRLINALGRHGKIYEVQSVYAEAQKYLAALEHDKKAQSAAWFQIEDQMIVALAQAGFPDAAHVHRSRILEHAGVPSADAYGSMISSVKETTDDAAHALALFEEAQVRGVVPNTYMYNTIISKLAKARKADYALELFHQMRTLGHRATSVTYGAVIAACCRVGDAPSAEELFQEMISQANFKPRVPPYNTMIQLYVHTKPNREKALFYYNALLDAHIQPSAHTYKLLLDAYGTIEPIDVAAMERVFERLVADKSVEVTGAHWASLINSWGCVQKNLEKAVEVFESIANHPASRRSGTPLPDAVAYEAIINVLVTLRRTDLLTPYIQRLKSSNVHMTAYIANLIIKGYAAGGDIERAREVFEGLVDPPEGVAAPNNHVSYSSNGNRQLPSTPVYREPSTWEAMVRAELGVGNRDRAIALLERLQSRKYPPAVYARISGIMLDDSVSPWASDASSVHSGSAATESH